MAYLVQFITAIPIFTTEIGNGAWKRAWYGSIESSGFHFLPFLAPSISVERSGKASDNPRGALNFFFSGEGRAALISEVWGLRTDACL